MADLERLARQQRAEILDVDARLARDLIESYQHAWTRLRDRLDALTRTIEAARAAGQAVDAGWLARQEHWRALELGLVAEVTQIARSANGTVSNAQWPAIRLAQAHAEAAVVAQLGPPPPGAWFSFAQLPADAVQALVRELGADRALGALVDGLGPDAAASVRSALADGLILGESTDRIARRARTAFGGNAVRATTVARTSLMRAYKSGSLASYRRNADVVRGWVWIAALGPRTCAACIAKHGSEHGLDEEFHDHPRGRCTAAPLVRSWAELGFDAPEQPAPAVATSGSAWFAAQPAAVQQRILGPAKRAAYAAGDLALEDLAGEARSRTWGTTLTEKSLTDVLGAERAKAFIAGARG